MHLQHTPSGVGSFAAARFKIIKDNEFVIGFADFNPCNGEFVFVPAQFVPMSVVMERCQKKGFSERAFDEAISRHDNEIKAAMLTESELWEVKKYIRDIPNPELQRAVEVAEQEATDRRTNAELESVRDNLIREIAGLTLIRDRLREETNG